MMSRRYKYLVGAVAAAWVAAMVWLVSQDDRPAAGPSSPAASLGAVSGIMPTGDEYMGAYLGGERIGWTRSTAIPRGRTGRLGWALHQEGLLKLVVQGQARTIETIGAANVDADFRLQSFSFRLITDGQVVRAEGQAGVGKLQVKVDFGAGPREMTFPLKKDILIDLNVDRYLAAKGLKPGDRFEIDVFDPQTMGTIPVKVQVVGMERLNVMGYDVYATHLRRTIGGATYDAWIDANGRSLKEQGPLGITLVRESPADAKKLSSKPGRDLITAASIQPDKAIPEPESRARLTVRLTGVDLSAYGLATWRQALDGDALTIRRDDLEALPKTPLPVTDPAFAPFLKAEPLIEADSPKIKKAVQEALAGEGALPAAALKLNDWLFVNMRKKNVIGVPDALASLASMEGDCNEHAFLYTAMARAAGIPSRVAAGIAYLGGKFYYHAWPEVWAGKWIALDPTWGQTPADVTHIRFVADDVSKLTDIAGLIGNLKIDVLGFE